MAKLNPQNLKALIERPGRYPDGQGLFFKTLGLGRAYWTYRYRSGGKERETSIGPYPEIGIEQARIKHADLRAMVLKKIDPVGDKRNAKAAVAAKATVPTFGQCADQYIAAHESGWKNPKHRQQWAMTLREYCRPIRETSVDQIDAKAVLRVLEPKWREAPETMSRLRGRIEVVLAAAQVAGHIDPDKPNPARWRGWLDHMLPPPKKIGSRGHHAAMPYNQLPAFMAKLGQTVSDSSRALAFTVLTCVRTSEALGATWDEIDFQTATWTIPKERMKMAKPHDVPLSDAAVAILRAQEIGRTARNDHVFPGRPMRRLSNMAMAMLMRRLGAGDYTVHGMRSTARSWMADQGVAFELAEAALAHQVGNAVVQAYQRSSMLERRRPIMSAWSAFVTGSDADNVVPLNRGVA
jgi:integrase